VDEQRVEAARVLLLGDPGLRKVSVQVEDLEAASFHRDRDRLQATLAAFRAEHGFGRAISAPQIGVAQRFIALNLGADPFTMINPKITWCSPETFTMWDDCMSFPFLLVRVRRHASVSVHYQNEKGEPCVMEHLDQATAELLQHEIDHLDGVLAVDHALDKDALVSRQVFEADPKRFASQVDYVIG
jgi:peptide deformylase